MPNHLPTQSPTDTAEPDQKIPSMLSITLQSGPDGVSVQAVEFTSGEVLTRCAFRGERLPHQVLSSDLAATVETLVGEAGSEIGILAKPDFSLTLPGLILTNVRVMVSRAREGMQYVSVRFARCFGNVAAVFTDQTRPWQIGYDQTAYFAAEMIEKVFVPLKNFASYLDTGDHMPPEGPLRDGLSHTRRKIEELELYYQVLAEFLASHGDRPVNRSTLALARLSEMH